MAVDFWIYAHHRTVTASNFFWNNQKEDNEKKSPLKTPLPSLKCRALGMPLRGNII